MQILRPTAAVLTGLMGLVFVTAVGCTGESGPTNGSSDGATRTTGTQQPVPFEVPASHWRPGQPAEQALLAGTLSLHHHCLVAKVGSNSVLVVWPEGFSGLRQPGGTAQVLNAEGEVAAIEGDHLSVGGGAGYAPSGWRCGGLTDAFFVQQAMP